MTYIHINMDEFVIIESYYHQRIPVTKITEYLNHTRESIYKVITFLEADYTDLDYYLRYKEIRRNFGDET